MRIINKDELKLDTKLVSELKNSIFIYPTDTIYGIGCDATNKELVAKVRRIKKSLNQPFSIIIPNKNIIFEYCKLHKDSRQWANKLPGPYTLIFNVKKRFFADNVNPKDNTVGVRIPNHWFYHYVKKMKVPIVTTSANIAGGDFMTSIEDLDEDLKKQVNYIIYDGPLKGRPSTIIHLEKEEVEIKDRSKPSVGEKIRAIKKVLKNNTPIKALRRLRSK